MNTPNSILFLQAVRIKTEDTFIAWFLKKDVQSLFYYVCRVFLSYYKKQERVVKKYYVSYKILSYFLKHIALILS